MTTGMITRQDPSPQRLKLTKNYPGKRPQTAQTVCVRSVSRKSRDLHALGSREVMVVMK